MRSQAAKGIMAPRAYYDTEETCEWDGEKFTYRPISAFTGSGELVFASSPTFVNPVIGVTATSRCAYCRTLHTAAVHCQSCGAPR